MKHISHTEPFREVDNRNNFFLIKQELKRYEKELELKAGKGFLNSNINSHYFHSSINNNFNDSLNNLMTNNFNIKMNSTLLSEKRNYDEDYLNLSTQKSRKLDKENKASPQNKSLKFQDDLEQDDLKIKKM